jgi:hypothetical protein
MGTWWDYRTSNLLYDYFTLFRTKTKPQMSVFKKLPFRNNYTNLDGFVFLSLILSYLSSFILFNLSSFFLFFYFFTFLHSHSSLDRIPRLNSLLQEWDGYISVSIYSSNILADYETLTQEFQNCNCSCRSRLSVHLIVGGTFHPYPINIMRNIALLNGFNSEIDLVSIYDIDFVPNSGLCRRIERWAEKIPDLNLLPNLPPRPTNLVQVPMPKSDNLTPFNGLKSFEHMGAAMLIPPAFEFPDLTEGQGVIWPENKDHLIELTESNKILRFHANFEGQEMNYTKWTTTTEPFIHSPIQLLNEHYAWFSRTVLTQATSRPLCDEAFFDRGYNKIMCYIELRLLGFVPIIVPDAWLLHVPEVVEFVGEKAFQYDDDSITLQKNENEKKGHREGNKTNEDQPHVGEEDQNDYNTQSRKEEDAKEENEHLEEHQQVTLDGGNQSQSEILHGNRRPTPVFYKRFFHYRICRELSFLGWLDVSNVCLRYCEIAQLKDHLSFAKSRTYLRHCYNHIVHQQGLTGELETDALFAQIDSLEWWIHRMSVVRQDMVTQKNILNEQIVAFPLGVLPQNPQRRQRRRKRKRSLPIG